MATRLEHLKGVLARWEAKDGPDSPSVRDLRAQIQGMERQVRQDYKTEQAVFGATMGNLQSSGPAAAPDPMRPAIDAIEEFLKDPSKAVRPTE